MRTTDYTGRKSTYDEKDFSMSATAISVIYRQISDPFTGEMQKVDIIEADTDERNAQRYCKLYGLQVPKDQKNRVAYHYLNVRVN